MLELIRLEGDASGKHIEYVHGTPVFRRRGSLLPIAYLNQVLGLHSVERDEAVNMVVLQAEDRQFGLVVDGINDTQEIVVKPLGKQLKGLTLYAGATIMGDGRVALILDVLGIGQRSGVLAEFIEQARTSGQQKAQADLTQQRLLLFRAGSFARLAVPLLSSPGWKSFRSRRSNVPVAGRWCNIATGFFPWWLCEQCLNRALRARNSQPIRCKWWFSMMDTAAWVWSWTRFWM